ncbi:MAG: MGMT family protein [Eggerthellaceae bacterium]|nr:MGMT family protein [Eggerthellaceae bacterium]
MGEFSDKVYEAVRRIPRGYVSTYGDIARAIGHPRSARYVGYALRGNPSPGDVIPCHRVVFKDGQICDNFAFGGSGVQKKLLEDEGVAFVNSMHVDMDRCHWTFASDGLGRPTDIDWAAEMEE